ncbi:MAG: glycosyltransferase family 9 protein [Desulfobacteraceae bacterium]|nr:glycosyltransferase family 9 protein [Desulfobacteraceae bacterium]MBC2754884.1 glycosyltransferase family 9 protein [Desulfobacteraceae bacterium]
MPRIEAKKICFIRTSALGDTVHALGLINGLRKGYPDAHLTWVIQTLPYDMVKHQKNIDQFITFNRNGDYKTWLSLFKRLREESYDLVILPQVSAKVSLITLFIKSKNKLGFDFKRSKELHWLVTNKRIPAAPAGHVQDQFFEFLDYLDIKDYPIEWNFTFTEEERAWQQSYFDRLKRPVIGFVIASSSRDKDWDLEKYAKVIDYVEQKLDLQPMLIGGPSELEKNNAEEICRLCRKEPIIALEKPIRTTMMQIAGSRLIVSPDTGPLHMAVSLNVPTISLYGYSNPKRCGPYRKYHDLLIDKYNDPGEENMPITRKTKPGRMARISPEEVIEKIELGLERYPASTMAN